MRHSVKDLFRPAIRDERELAAFVVRTCVICASAALAVDVANQMIFFDGWVASLRSWGVTVVLATAIALSGLARHRQGASGPLPVEGGSRDAEPHRRADRPAEPAGAHADRRDAAARDDGAGDRRYRPLQAGQRQLRPHGGRCGDPHGQPGRAGRTRRPRRARPRRRRGIRAAGFRDLAVAAGAQAGEPSHAHRADAGDRRGRDGRSRDHLGRRGDPRRGAGFRRSLCRCRPGALRCQGFGPQPHQLFAAVRRCLRVATLAHQVAGRREATPPSTRTAVLSVA